MSEWVSPIGRSHEDWTVERLADPEFAREFLRDRRRLQAAYDHLVESMPHDYQCFAGYGDNRCECETEGIVREAARIRVGAAEDGDDE